MKTQRIEDKASAHVRRMEARAKALALLTSRVTVLVTDEPARPSFDPTATDEQKANYKKADALLGLMAVVIYYGEGSDEEALTGNLGYCLDCGALERHGAEHLAVVEVGEAKVEA